MPRDPRIDAYIASAPSFAQPILRHIRGLVHSACPEVVETVKWSRPHFDYRDRILAGMSAFKAHAALMLWRTGETAPTHVGREGMGQFGRLTTVSDLPDDSELVRMIRAAAATIDDGPPRKAKAVPRTILPVPDELAAALADAPVAKAVFDGFSASNRRDYCEWIGEAKRAETRATRTAQAIEWLAEGKPRHWKYQR
ncbi:MAG TPA: YdeI/OmpD-associated family protein [Sphingomonas sp.]|nr:YdeI/OmpD-associated family protein [Sphingomonas sp.]